MPITNERVAEILPASDLSWLRAYVEYAQLIVPSPHIYHVGVGLGVLASVCRPDYMVNYVFRNKAHPTLWPLMVGSSSSGKTQAMEIGQDLLSAAAPTLIGGDPRSEEGFIKSLERKRKQTLIYPAFEQFLGSTSGNHDNNYRAKIRDGMTAAFDSGNYQAEKANTSISIDGIRLSIIAACTPGHLRTHTSLIDWDGGFISRFMMFYGAPSDITEFRPARPEQLADMRSWLIDQLIIRADATQDCHIKPGECLGMTEEASSYFFEWTKSLKHYAEKIDHRIRPCIRRTELMASKVAVILAYDYGQAIMNDGADWWLDMDVIKVATDIANLHAEALIELTAAIASNGDMLICNQILEELPEDGGWMHRGVILKKVGLLTWNIGRYVDTLEERGEVEVKAENGAIWLRRILGGCPPDYQESIAEEASSDLD